MDSMVHGVIKSQTRLSHFDWLTYLCYGYNGSSCIIVDLSTSWGFYYLQNSSKDMAQNIIYSPWGGTKCPWLYLMIRLFWSFPDGSVSKESAWNAGELGLIPGSGGSPEGHDNPLLYSCLENSMKRGAWWAIVHEVAKSQTDWAINTLIFFSLIIILSYLTAFYLSLPFFTSLMKLIPWLKCFFFFFFTEKR